MFDEFREDLQKIKDWVNGQDSVPWEEEVDEFFKPFFDKYEEKTIIKLEGTFTVKDAEGGGYLLEKMTELHEEQKAGTDCQD